MAGFSVVSLPPDAALHGAEMQFGHASESVRAKVDGGPHTFFFFGIFFSPILFFASANLRNCKMAAGGGGGGGDDDDDGDGCI